MSQTRWSEYAVPRFPADPGSPLEAKTSRRGKLSYYWSCGMIPHGGPVGVLYAAPKGRLSLFGMRRRTAKGVVRLIYRLLCFDYC